MTTVEARPDIDFHDLDRFPRECRGWFRWLRAHEPMSFHSGPPFQPEHDGFWSLVLYDTRVGDRAAVEELSLVMKGEVLPAGTRWAGIPAARAVV